MRTQGDVRDAANPRGEDEHEGSDAGEHVAEAGDEADEAVEPEADAGAGDAEKVVEQVGEEVEILVGEPAFGALAQGERGDRGSSISGRQNLGFHGALA